MTALPQKKDIVCLLHGLASGPWMMQYLGYFLRKKSFQTCFLKYASLRQSFEKNVETIQTCLINMPPHIETIDLVAHSLGGVILLKALELKPDPRIKRIVLLGSPLQGSRYAQVFTRHKIGRFCLRRNASLWENMPRLVLPPAEVGVISGNHSPRIKLWPAIRIEMPNDGMVSVQETHIAGLKDFSIMPVNHLSMLFSARVGKAIAHFLDKGIFQ